MIVFKRAYRVVLVVAMMAAAMAAGQNGQRRIAVVIEEPRQHIPDFSLVEALNNGLSMYVGLGVMIPGTDTTLPEPPRTRFNLEHLVEWGQETGVRYIIYLQVSDRSIARERNISIPFLLSRYVVEGRLDGAYSLIDTQRRKAIGTWNLRTSLPGPQQWQVVDDYRDDPGLHIPAPQKLVFLRKLEEKGAAEIIQNVVPHLKGR